MLNENNNDGQVEFLGDFSTMSARPKKDKFRLGKIAVSLSYENIFVFIIGLIMLLIVCYSLGVEKGKELVQLETPKFPKVEVKEEAIPPKPQLIKPAEEKKVRVEVVSTKVEPPAKKIAPLSKKGFSYIQVGSFLSDKYAKKAMEQLQHKGYASFTTKVGKYNVVFVGGYQNQEEAKQALKKLKTLYADCLLRHK